MAIEFEAKVLITAEEFINIMTEKNLGFAAFSLYKKEDEYWSKYSSVKESIENNESLTRIREDVNGTTLTLKKKKMDGNFENNQELETKIQNRFVIEALLKEAGYRPYFNKYKTSWRLDIRKDIDIADVEVNAEVEIIENTKNKSNPNYKCFYAIEIEAVSNNEAFTNEYLSKVIKNAFHLFDKTERDFETRSWQELLA